MTTKHDDGLSEYQKRDLELRERQLAAQEEANALARASHAILAKTSSDRIVTSDQAAIKSLQFADETYKVRTAERAYRIVRLEKRVEGVEYPSTVAFSVQQTLGCAADAPWVGRWKCGPPIGTSWDTSELEEIYMNFLLGLAKDTIESFRRRGDDIAAKQVEQRLRGVHSGVGDHTPGLRHATYAFARLPILRLVTGRFHDQLEGLGVKILGQVDPESGKLVALSEGTQQAAE
jgi:hypothetical protein